MTGKLAYGLVACIAIGVVAYFVGSNWRSGPKPVVDVAVLDFGKMAPGSKSEKSFRVRNTGREVLRVNAIRTGCGCAEAHLINGPEIHPGDEAGVVVKMQVDRNRARGGMANDLYLFTNSRTSPRLHVKLLVEPSPVEEGFDSVLDFGQVQRSELPASRVFKRKFSVEAAPKWSITELDSDDYHMEPENGNLRITVADQVPAGEIHETMSYQIEGESKTRESVLVGNIMGEYVAAPGMILIGPIYAFDSEFSETIEVWRRDGNGNVRIIGLTVSDSLAGIVEVELDAERSNRAKIIGKLTKPDLISPRTISGKVVFEVDGGITERLSVPLVLVIGKERV